MTLRYDEVKRFWNERANAQDIADPRSITFFCDDPEALEFRDRREKDLFDRKFRLHGNHAVLEIGCGSGRWTAFLAHRCGSLTAVDAAANLVEVNRKALVEGERLRHIEYAVADGLTLDLPKKDFDVITCFGVSLYITDADLVPFFGRLAAHLKPGGVLFVKDPLTASGTVVRDNEYSDALGTTYSCIYRPTSEWEKAVGQAGLVPEFVEPVYSPDDPLAPVRDGMNTWLGMWVKPE